jgi:hypothetical protein
MERLARIRLLEHAASELLESETNGSLRIGVDGSPREPLVITAFGCSVLVAVGHGPSVLMAVSSVRSDGGPGARALAEGCDCALRAVHDLADDFTPTLSFGDPANAKRFAGRPHGTLAP